MNKNPIKVFLDDTRIPSEIYGDKADDEWVLVATVEEVIDALKNDNVSHLSLDNDLGIGNKEGHILIPWMMDNNVWPTEEVYVHSANPYWASRMKEDIKRYYYGCVKPQMVRERNKSLEEM